MAVDKKKIIDGIIGELKKEMPEEKISLYGEQNGAFDIKTLTTGSIGVDFALGGGFPVGRISCVAGHTSSGKTSLAMTTAGELQRAKKAKGEEAVILYIDAEAALDPKYARSVGFDVDSAYVVRPENGENGYEIAEKFASSGVCDLIIIDSIAAMIPQAFFENEIGDQNQIGLGARLDAQGIGRLFGIAAKNNTTVICINQFKKAVKINSYERTDGVSGNMEMTGGQVIKFYFSVIAEVQRVGKIYSELDNGQEQISTNQTRCRILKNKIAPAGRESDFFLTFGEGIDKAQEATEFGIQYGLVTRNGAMHSITGSEERFRGRQKFIDYLKANPEILDDLIKKVREKVFASHSENLNLSEDTEVIKDVANPLD